MSGAGNDLPVAEEQFSIAKTAVPRTRFDVRRRRYDGRTSWLVSRNDWYELDELSDQVWVACDRGLTVEQIARHVAEHNGLALGDALAAAVLALDLFRELGLVELDD